MTLDGVKVLLVIPVVEELNTLGNAINVLCSKAMSSMPPLMPRQDVSPQRHKTKLVEPQLFLLVLVQKGLG